MELLIGDISVIICCYTEKRWSDLVAAVDSLRVQTLPFREIIVVVDHNPRMLERVKAEITGVVAIANREKQGLSGARNSGIRIASGNYIAFLDDDAVAEPDWLYWLSQGCTQSRILGAGGKVDPLWLVEKPAWFPDEFYWVLGCSYKGLPRETTRIRNPFGGCTAIKRNVFDTVGGFRSEIGRIGSKPLGGEETELGIRARLAWPEYDFLYEPRARIQHRIPAARASWSYFCARCYSEGLSKALIVRLVGRKHGLSSERVYTRKTLPLGVLKGLSEAVIKGDLSGLGRAGAIITGLAITVAGYLVGSASLKVKPAVSEADGSTTIAHDYILNQ
ncbi:MAG TPA: glycosyltransferase family 2 protein [Chloroflexia bacterium]|nr:glycosyltransferase family 2 protein [Chloroflexia bacterium]